MTADGLKLAEWRQMPLKFSEDARNLIDEMLAGPEELTFRQKLRLVDFLAKHALGTHFTAAEETLSGQAVRSDAGTVRDHLGLPLA